MLIGNDFNLKKFIESNQSKNYEIKDNIWSLVDIENLIDGISEYCNDWD